MPEALSAHGGGRGGFLLLDKPRGMSSFQALHPLKRLFRGRRVGHAGTLDPAASGLLLAGVGAGTRLLEYLEGRPKTYTFLARFGLASDTYDMEGAVTGSPALDVTREEVERALPAFRGRIRQTPPAYSAVKVDGKRAYALARAGEAVELESREVEVMSLELLGCEAGNAALRMTCSKGTYVRSLVHDLGRALGRGAVADDIRRTAIGPFRIEDAIPVAELAGLAKAGGPAAQADGPAQGIDRPAAAVPGPSAPASGDAPGPSRQDPVPLMPLETAVAYLPAAILPAHRVAALRDGRSTAKGQYRLEGDGLAAAPAPEGSALRVLDPDGRLLAIAALDAEGNLCPRKVLIGP
jgi:tRNA pseudouridine55 synthase